eukprot:TRINITY_DN25558_c0_g1_i1.p1 TRINITY_DN25558_c0_g1~~TRINITY_DN25558_c0_g1_i1.p1  ORF type:complete len:664 (-),score=219.18 TRINITY_DN25558_c0_g1_i1:173-2164(-)
MFWDSFHNSSNLEALCSNDGDIVAVLNETELLQEIKAANSNVISFFKNKVNMDKMISFINGSGTSDASLSSIASEIFVLEQPEICRGLLEVHENMTTLCKPVITGELVKEKTTVVESEDKEDDSDSEKGKDGSGSDDDGDTLDISVNLTFKDTVSNVAKVLLALVNLDSQETVPLLHAMPGLLGGLCPHFTLPPVNALLSKLANLSDTAEGAENLDWLVSGGLLDELLGAFTEEYSLMHHSAASDMLLSLMRLRGSQYVQNPGAPPPIDDIPPAKSPGAKIGVILKEKYADLLVSRVTTKSKTGLMSVVDVLVEVLRRAESTRTLSLSGEPMPSTNVPTIILSFIPRLPLLIAALDQSPISIVDRGCVGIRRAKILELFSSLLATDYDIIDEAFADLRVVTKALDLFFEFPWNNILHNAVVKIVTTALKGNSSVLRNKVVRDAQLTRRLLTAVAIDEKLSCGMPGKRTGYMGHITLLANEVDKASELYDDVKEAVTGDEEWTAYTETHLKQMNHLLSTPLAGEEPQILLNESDDDDLSIPVSFSDLSRYQEALDDALNSLATNTFYATGVNSIPISSDFEDELGFEDDDEWANITAKANALATEDDDDDEELDSEVVTTPLNDPRSKYFGTPRPEGEDEEPCPPPDMNEIHSSDSDDEEQTLH